MVGAAVVGAGVGSVGAGVGDNVGDLVGYKYEEKKLDFSIFNR